MEKPDFAALLEKYRKGECTPEELDFLEHWYMRYNEDAAPLSEAELEADARIMTNNLAPVAPVVLKKPTLIRRVMLPVSVAASVLVLISIGLSRFAPSQRKETPILPGRQAATLTLSNGKKIILSDPANGEIARESGVIISKNDQGEVIYRTDPGTAQQNGYNQLATTNGETYRIQLPDGSKVWLNAASSLKYPISFSNTGQRKVELKGEAYFEIAQDQERPFIVASRDQQVEVLGTHFNVNAYPDEATIKTTLLEGSVRVRPMHTNEGILLKPGQQAIVQHASIHSASADISETMAWKEGYFRFRNESIQSVMRKIARWYDVEVVFEGAIPEEAYSGAITRHGDIRQVLDIMAGSNNIHFNIQGRTIIVSK